MGVLKIKISGQRVKYEIAKVTFEDSDLLRARSWKWDNKRNSLYCNDNKLDIDAYSFCLCSGSYSCNGNFKKSYEKCV